MLSLLSYSILGAFGLILLILVIVLRECLEGLGPMLFRATSLASQILMLAAILALCCQRDQPGIPVESTIRVVGGIILFVSGLYLEGKGTFDLGLKRSVGGVCVEMYSLLRAYITSSGIRRI